MLNKWYLYVVECADGTLYTGITTDVKRRINEHKYSFKSAKYTRSRRPVTLLMANEHESHSSAAKAEWRFKRLTRKQKLEKINASKNEKSILL